MIKIIRKLINWMKPKCPNCNTILSRDVWGDNTVELYCLRCGYSENYNDSYP